MFICITETYLDPSKQDLQVSNPGIWFLFKHAYSTSYVLRSKHMKDFETVARTET